MQLTWNHIKRNERLHREAKQRFESAWKALDVPFGKRVTPPHDRTACACNCGHPVCAQGCTAR